MERPSWDLLVTIFFIMGIGYGFILQRDRILATLVGTYIGLAVTTVWGDTIYSLFSGNTVLFNQLWFRSSASPFTIKVALFAFFIVMLSLKGEFVHMTKRNLGAGSPIILFAYAFLSSGLILSSIFGFMDPVTQTRIAATSHLASLVMHYKVAWIVLPAIVMVIAGFIKDRRPPDYYYPPRDYY